MYKWLSFMAFAAIAILIGCGGGGSGVGGSNGVSNGGSNGGTGGGSGVLSVFLTDSYESEHDHVWVTVRQIDVVGSSGRATVFRDDAGRQLDLKSLRDATGGRFAFVSSSTVGSRTYSEAELTLSKDLGVVATGAEQTLTKEFSDSLDDGTGQVKVKARLTPRNLGSGAQELVLDFDLKNFGVDDRGKVIPKIVEGSRSGLDDVARHESEDYHGTIANLSGIAPDLSFDLVTSYGTIGVSTNSETVVFNSAGVTSPSIQVGGRVEVGGVFVTGQRILAASSIKIEDASSSNDPHEVTGIPSQHNVDNGTFDVAVRSAHGFLPPGTRVTVQVTDATVFRTETGVLTDKATFFGRLGSSGQVEVEGSMNGNTFRATKAKLDDAPGHAHEAEAKGVASGVNPSGGTLTLALAEYEGFLPGSSSISVKIIDATVFKNATRDTFFTEASAGTRIKIKGTYADGVLTAMVAEVSGGGGGSTGGDDGGHNSGGTSGGTSGSTTGGDDGGTTGGTSGSTTGGDDGGHNSGGTTGGTSGSTTGGDDGGHNSGGDDGGTTGGSSGSTTGGDDGGHNSGGGSNG